MTDTTTSVDNQDAENLAIQAGENDSIESAEPTEKEEKSFDDLLGLSHEELGKLLLDGTSPVTEGDAPSLEEDKKGQHSNHIPPQRLNQEISKRKTVEQEAAERIAALEAENVRLREEAAYRAGKVDALQTKADAAPDIDPELVIQQNLQTLEANYDQAVTALAEKFDNGELSAKEWREEESKLQKAKSRLQGDFLNKLDEVRSQKNAVPVESLWENAGKDSSFIEFANRLVADNPWVSKLPNDLASDLNNKAVEYLETKGITLSSSPTYREILQYRADVSAAVVEVGKSWKLDKAFSEERAAPATTSPNPNAVDPVKLQSKLDIINKGQPPSPTLAGVSLPTSAIAGLPKDIDFNDLEKMTPELLEQLLAREEASARVVA